MTKPHLFDPAHMDPIDEEAASVCPVQSDDRTGAVDQVREFCSPELVLNRISRSWCG